MTAAVPIAWLVARAAGLVAFGLLTLSVWLGLSMSTRLLPPKRTKRLLGLHRTLAWMGLWMVGLHRRRDPGRPCLPLRRPRCARSRRGALQARRGRARRRRRVADPRPGRLVQCAALDRAEGLAPAALRDLRRLLARPRTRAPRRHRLEGIRRPDCSRPSRISRVVAELLQTPRAPAGPNAPPGGRALRRCCVATREGVSASGRTAACPRGRYRSNRSPAAARVRSDSSPDQERGRPPRPFSSSPAECGGAGGPNSRCSSSTERDRASPSRPARCRKPPPVRYDA